MKRKRDLLANAALAMAVIGTASAEYQLARESGWGVVSFALPGALDVYAVRAMRAHRDVVLMAAVMFGVNAMSHLVSAGLLTAAWPVVVAVSALPILVLVRVHAIRETTPEVEAEPTEVLPEPLSVPAEPADFLDDIQEVPVVIERVTERAPGVPNGTLPLTFGPLVPVAELLAGTSRDQGGFKLDVMQLEAPEPAEPAPVVPEPEAEPQPEPIEVPPGVSAEHVNLARHWIATDPKLTGTEIGTRLGTSDGYGRRVRRAVLALETTS